MSEFQVKIQSMGNILDTDEQCISILQQAYSSINGVKRNLTLQCLQRARIDSRLTTSAKTVSSEESALRRFVSTGRSAVRLYETTEQKLMQGMGNGKTLNVDTSNVQHSTGGGRSSDGSGGGGGGSWGDEDTAGANWWDRLSDFLSNVIFEGADQLADAIGSTVCKAVGSIADWALTCVDCLVSNLKEYGHNWGSGEMWTETLVESVLGITVGEVVGALVGAGIAAIGLTGGAAAVIGVGAVAAITVLVDWGLDVVAGGDWKDTVGDAIISAGEAISEAWSGICNWFSGKSTPATKTVYAQPYLV